MKKFFQILILCGVCGMLASCDKLIKKEPSVIATLEVRRTAQVMLHNNTSTVLLLENDQTVIISNDYNSPDAAILMPGDSVSIGLEDNQYVVIKTKYTHKK